MEGDAEVKGKAERADWESEGWSSGETGDGSVMEADKRANGNIDGQSGSPIITRYGTTVTPRCYACI